VGIATVEVELGPVEPDIVTDWTEPDLVDVVDDAGAALNLLSID
jgi:hypothetical protein